MRSIEVEKQPEDRSRMRNRTPSGSHKHPIGDIGFSDNPKPSPDRPDGHMLNTKVRQNRETMVSLKDDEAARPVARFQPCSADEGMGIPVRLVPGGLQLDRKSVV